MPSIIFNVLGGFQQCPLHMLECDYSPPRRYGHGHQWNFIVNSHSSVAEPASPANCKVTLANAEKLANHWNWSSISHMHGKPLFAVSQWSTQSKLKIPNKDTHIGFSRSVSLYLHLLLSPHITCPIFCYLNEHTDMSGIGVFWVLNRFHLRSRSWILFSQASCVMSQKQQLDCGRAKFCWLWLGLTGVCLGEETS